MKCRKCGVVIGFGIYPEPGSPTEKMVERGELFIGGCIPGPVPRCPKCGANMGRKRSRRGTAPRKKRGVAG